VRITNGSIEVPGRKGLSRENNNNIMIGGGGGGGSSSSSTALEVHVTEMVGCNSTAQTLFSSNVLHSNNMKGGK